MIESGPKIPILKKAASFTENTIVFIAFSSLTYLGYTAWDNHYNKPRAKPIPINCERVVNKERFEKKFLYAEGTYTLTRFYPQTDGTGKIEKDNNGNPIMNGIELTKSPTESSNSKDENIVDYLSNLPEITATNPILVIGVPDGNFGEILTGEPFEEPVQDNQLKLKLEIERIKDGKRKLETVYLRIDRIPNYRKTLLPNIKTAEDFTLLKGTKTNGYYSSAKGDCITIGHITYGN